MKPNIHLIRLTVTLTYSFYLPWNIYSICRHLVELNQYCMLHILTYCYLCIQVFMVAEEMTTEAKSNSSMESGRLALPMLDSSIPYKSWKNKLH